MSDVKVGAGILNIITESLYDNPIVVFREYVQNAVDSIYKSDMADVSDIRIIKEERASSSEKESSQQKASLIFVDNGNGIDAEDFFNRMVSIADSAKIKQKNIGYKGIGRFSGVPYCQRLVFYNVIDFSKDISQMYSLDGEKYNNVKSNEKIRSMSISELLNEIGDKKEIGAESVRKKFSRDFKLNEYFERHNTGFAVIMESISPVLENIISEKDFLTELSWLLPVDFDEKLYNDADDETKRIIKKLHGDNSKEVAARCCNIFYNDEPLYRPIKPSNLRSIVSELNFGYAIGFQSFSSQKIMIDKKNEFSGIRLYVDNMLLCDESEIIQNLDNYGLLNHSVNGMIQSARGIGAVLYITDKESISTNARRTFIEVTDYESIDFLGVFSEYLDRIYSARYALSNYASALRDKASGGAIDTTKYKNEAYSALTMLMRQNIVDSNYDIADKIEFAALTDSEKKKIIKRAITRGINEKIKEYLKELNPGDLESVDEAYSKFVEWLMER